jgi:uncharacterized protein YcbK (DUF882 family)
MGLRESLSNLGGFDVPLGFARKLKWRPSRAGLNAGLASLVLMASASSVHNATASSETRTLSFRHTHSGEELTVTFKRNGRYDEDGLQKLNHLLRDWRNQDKTTMDRRLFDILWEVYRDVDGKSAIQIISAYRSPATNAMLRRRSSGVARHSQHMLGHAMDFFIPGVALEKVRIAGLRLQRGGVGFYPTSGSPFVHLDTGSIRHWPRMTYAQLERVFPNGRTVHLPSSGGTMPGYQLAAADIQKRGSGDSVSRAGSKPGNLLASLFGRKSSDDEDESAAPAIAPAKPTPAATVVAAVMPEKSADPVPMPRAKPPSANIQLASADTETIPLPRPKQQIIAAPPAPKNDGRPQNPSDIINARGFWDDIPEPKQATPQQVAALTARQALDRIAEQEQQAGGTNVSAFAKALAYAPPANSPVDRSHVVAASAPMPRSVRPNVPNKNSMVVNEVTTVIGKSLGQAGPVAISTRLTAAYIPENHIWTRAMIVAPSVTTAMSVSTIGDGDLTVLRTHFAKPQTVVAMSFSDDPQVGLVSNQFTGSATAKLMTTSFAMRTASLR